DEGVAADGLVIAMDGQTPIRVRYQLNCDAGWRVRTLALAKMGEAGRQIELHADGAGHWTDAAHRPIPALDGCLDVDISVTPFTNTLPIRRLGLKPGEATEIAAVYIAAEEMQVRMMRQRYTCLEVGPDFARYRYENVASDFTAELTVNIEGLVIEYPQLWSMVWPTQEQKLC
ncbi:MAG: hypothetical protein DLM69_02255, partial [Candidatus Chloroheliales bacterium]